MLSDEFSSVIISTGLHRVGHDWNDLACDFKTDLLQETSINQNLLYLRDDFQEILHGLYLISNVIRNELEVPVKERLDWTMVEYSLSGDLHLCPFIEENSVQCNHYAPQELLWAATLCPPKFTCWNRIPGVMQVGLWRGNVLMKFGSSLMRLGTW